MPPGAARSFALLFRISDRGNLLAREAAKVTLLAGRSAAVTHRRLARAVAVLRTFARRRQGGLAISAPSPCKAPPSSSPVRPGDVSPATTRVSDTSAAPPGEGTEPSWSPRPSPGSARSEGAAGDPGGSPREDAQGDGGTVAAGKAAEIAAAAATAAVNAAQAATKAAAAAAAAKASAVSAAASALAATGEAEAEEGRVVEALEMVRSVLSAAKFHRVIAGTDVERIASGVGLAPALIGALRALRREEVNGNWGMGMKGAGALVEEVSGALFRRAATGCTCALERRPLI